MFRLSTMAFLVTVAILASLPALGGEVVVAFPHANATFTDAADGTVGLDIPGFISGTSAGDPALPSKEIWVLLPPDADVKTLSVTIRDLAEEEVPGSFEIAPGPPAVSADEAESAISWGNGKEIVGGRNALTYQNHGFYPGAYATPRYESRMGEYLLVPVVCSPYRYNPVTGKLVHITGGQIVVSFDTTASATLKTTKSGVGGRAKLDGFVVNSGDANSWYGAPPAPRGALGVGNDRLLILTTTSIQSASTRLASFVTHKNTIMPTTLYTQSAWGGTGLTGNAATEAVRNWLKTTMYDPSYDTTYVLIIADPRSSSTIPMKDTWPRGLPPDLPVHPTDHYYADITGNWDLNGDGYYGGPGDVGTGGCDLVPEYIVGRIPYYSSITNLDKILLKTINFETNTNVGSWAQRVLIPMVPTDASTPNWALGEAIRTDACNPTARAYYRLYYDNWYPGMSGTIMPIPERIPTNYSNVLAEWQKGYGYCFWFTHGNTQLAADVFYSDLCQYLPDNKPAFTFQASCLNGVPSDTYNLGYTLLWNGAIGTVSASELSWYWPGQTTYNDGGSMDADLTYTFALRMARDKMRAGDALFNIKDHLPYDCNPVVFNLYGDPTVAGRWPTSLTVETATVTPAVRSRYYQFEFKAAGGVTSYYWSRTAGSLPPGLSLVQSGTNAGRLYGTPTTAGTYTFTLQVLDSSSPQLVATRELTMQVNSSLSIVTGSTLPRGNTHEAYSVGLEATGGATPYVWSCITVVDPEHPTVRLPPGLTLSEDGTISGTPTEKGSYSFLVRLTEGNRYVVTKTFYITTTYTYILPTALPIGQGGQPYSATLQADGGTAPYNWTLYSGTMPAGLSLSSAGVISGTAREFGNFTLTFRATDATLEYATRTFPLSILVVAYSFPMDTNPTDPALPVSARWTRDGSWAWGQPLGQGDPACPDPTSGYTGLNVCGYNLAGDYQNGMATVRYLTTGTLDLSGIVNTTLRFCRWLGVEGNNRDEANIEASPDGVTWSEIWSSFSSSASILDHAWSVQSYDLSSVVDLHGTAKLRWGMGETDSSVKYCGWNIDDVQILGVPSPTVRMGSVANARSLADGASCMLGGHVVTANFVSTDGYFYIQAPGTHQGMRVVWPHGGTITVGKYILVQGTMQTEAGNGERYLAGDCLFKDTGTAPTVKPVSTALRSLGGSDFELQRGVTDGTWVGGVLQCQPAVGLGNLGCLVRVTGKVTATGSGYFYIDDGSRLADGTSLANVGVRVLGTLSSSAVGHQAVVTGIISGFVQSTHFMRVIRPTAFYLAN